MREKGTKMLTGYLKGTGRIAISSKILAEEYRTHMRLIRISIVQLYGDALYSEIYAHIVAAVSLSLVVIASPSVGLADWERWHKRYLAACKVREYIAVTY